MRVVGRPPIAGAAVHLLLGDELGHAILDDATAILRQRLVGMRGEIIDMQILIEHVRDAAAARRDGGVGGEARSHDGLDRGLRGFAQVVVEELAVQWEQQRAAARRERIFQDTGQRRGTLPLAPPELLVGELFVRGREPLGIDQEAGPGLVEVVLPQIQAVLILGLPLKVGHPRAVGGDLQAHDRGTRERGCVEQAVDGQLGALCRGGGQGDQGGRQVTFGVARSDHGDSNVRVGRMKITDG